VDACLYSIAVGNLLSMISMIRPESGGWQSAVNWKAVCQGVIIVVAIRGIRARELAIDLNPAPVILLRESPCLYRDSALNF
jgi:hypothetical protein